MAKITLTQLSTFDNTNVSSLNDSLQKIEDALNDNVLYRDNITGEPNQAEQEYDMNSFRIINLGEPINNTDAVRLVDLQSGGAGSVVTTVFGRDGDVTAESGDYTTDQVTEGSNLYYTSSRVQNDAPVSSVANKTGAVEVAPSDLEQEGATDGQVMTWDDTAGQWEPQASGGAPVDSVFGRTGAVVAEVGDYDITDLGQTGASDGQTVRWSDFNNQWEPAAPGAAPVDSVFGRTGFVTAQSGDYTTDQVSEAGNLYYTDARAEAAAPVQSVVGRTGDVVVQPADLHQQSATSGQVLKWNDGTARWAVRDLNDSLSSAVTSFEGRSGDVTGQSGDYNTDQVPEGANLYFTNARAQNAVDVPVDSVFGRTGDVTAQAGDYTATKITISDTAGNFSSSNVEGALTELAQSDFSSSFATPEEFGAAGDGTTDDTTPVRNAIQSGRPVLLGPKTYRCTSEINYTDSNLMILGAGHHLSRLFFDNSDGLDIDMPTRYSGLILKDFTFITNSTNYIALDVFVDAGNTTGDQARKVIENVGFWGKDRHDFTSPGFTQHWRRGIQLIDCDRTTIKDCIFQGPEGQEFDGTDPEIRGVMADHCSHLHIYDCHFTFCSRAVYIEGLSEEVDCNFCNMVACGYGVIGRNITQPSNAWRVTNCHIAAWISCINIGKDAGSDRQIYTGITGNSLFKRSQTTYSPFHYVDINSARSTISNNQFHSLTGDISGDRSIVFSGGNSYNSITGNIFYRQDTIVTLPSNNTSIGVFNNIAHDDGDTITTDPVSIASGSSYSAAHNIGDRTNW